MALRQIVEAPGERLDGQHQGLRGHRFEGRFERRLHGRTDRFLVHDGTRDVLPDALFELLEGALPDIAEHLERVLHQQRGLIG